MPKKSGFPWVPVLAGGLAITTAALVAKGGDEKKKDESAPVPEGPEPQSLVPKGPDIPAVRIDEIARTIRTEALSRALMDEYNRGWEQMSIEISPLLTLDQVVKEG